MARTPGKIVQLRMKSTRNDKYWTKHVPDFFDYKTVLYIGIEKYRCVFVKNLLDHGYIIDILEIWKPHIDHYKEANKELGIFRNIYHGDVKKIDRVISTKQKYDIVFWFHGPEHIEKDELSDTIIKLKEYTRKLLVLACPYGKTESPARGGNKYNKHVSGIFPKDLFDLGFNIYTEKGRIQAWWRK